ncbi:MAG TPA: plasmid partitioning protein RepB C-terminal domain-containing protein [Nevskia sp.]|nr:plasmid partitioning protein RepB C-terminal domain-containing protein [Nevskia sp.]
MKQVNGIQKEGGDRPGLKSAFLRDCARVLVDDLLPLKKVQPIVKNSQKYQQILASVRAVGLVEPPAVSPVARQAGKYFILDGHLRVEALKDLGIREVNCMVATDDDTYTYNKRVNRLSPVQDHKMIVRAVERGVSTERIAETLGLSPLTIQHRFRLLNGICPDAVALLADKPCPAKNFDVLRRMKPIRQIEAAELMVCQNNFTGAFALAILSATPPDQLVPDPKGGGNETGSVESMARMERELAALQAQNHAVEDTYGPDVLHLTVVKGYLASLLSRAAIVRWLAKHRPEYLREFQNIAELTELPVESGQPH